MKDRDNTDKEKRDRDGKATGIISIREPSMGMVNKIKFDKGSEGKPT